MRLLCVASWFPYPPDNGSKRRAYSLMRELARAHALTLVSFAEPGEAERGRSGLEPLCRIAGVVPGNPAKSTSSVRTMALLSAWPRSFRDGYRREMQQLVDRLLPDHDAVVAFQPGAALYLLGRRQIPAIFDEPEVTVLHERFLFEPRPLHRARRGLTWWKFSRFVRNLVLTADRTSVVSDSERGQLIALGCPADRLAVVPNGADLELVPAPSAVDPGTLVYPGSLTYSANHDAVTWFLAEVWPLVLRDRPDARFVVTGATDGVRLDALPPTPRVTFTGHLQDARVFVAGMTAAVVPLRIGGGTRIKILEAMAAGTPVVATSKAVEGLRVTRGVDVLVGDTPEQFANQIRRVLDDTSLRSRLAASGRALVAERYTWAAAGLRMTRLVEEACESFRGARG